MPDEPDTFEGKLLDRELSRGAFELDPEPTIIDLRELGREQISELAEAMSGVGRAGSPTAYRSARRQLERWRKGGVTLRASSRERLRGAKRQASAHIRRLRARGANMKLRVSWYGSRKPEWLPPDRWIRIPREPMRAVIRTWAEGDADEAAAHLISEFYGRYGVPNEDDWLTHAEVIDMKLEPR